MVRQTLDDGHDGGRLGGLPMSQRREDPDRELMARVEARDTDALAELYDRHSARLLGLARRMTAPEWARGLRSSGPVRFG